MRGSGGLDKIFGGRGKSVHESVGGVAMTVIECNGEWVLKKSLRLAG